jgi:lambda repressor-like predicted transcriptional regulator
MGWDGYACRVKFDDWHKADVLERLSKDEAMPLLAETEGALALLGDSLHVACREIARALAKATGEEPYNLEWWPEKVREIASRASWDFKGEGGDNDCRDTAKVFLQICADNGLGIRFD